MTSHKPLVVAPGSTIPLGTLVTALVYSSSLASTVAQISLPPDARRIVLDVNSTVAEDLLATGKQLLANGEATAVPVVEPTDLALTFISGGIALPYTHLVGHFYLRDRLQLTMSISEFDGSDGVMAIGLPRHTSRDSSEHQRRRSILSPSLDAVRIRLLPLLRLHFGIPQSRPRPRLCRSSRRPAQLGCVPSNHSPRRTGTSSRNFAARTAPQQNAR